MKDTSNKYVALILMLLFALTLSILVIYFMRLAVISEEYERQKLEEKKKDYMSCYECRSVCAELFGEY